MCFYVNSNQTLKSDSNEIARQMLYYVLMTESSINQNFKKAASDEVLAGLLDDWLKMCKI